MIKHIVMFWLKDEDKTEKIQSLKVQLLVLENKIPELVKIEVGVDFNGSDAAADLVLYTEFHNRSGLHAYQIHPEHQKVVAYVKEVTTRRHVVDYEGF